MRSSRILVHLAKSRTAKTFSVVAGLLLVLQPYAFALNQIVEKYPTGFAVGTTNMGNGMVLQNGTVFGFNSAKSAADTDAYAVIQEGACMSPLTGFDYTEGREGFATGATTGSVTYGYSGVQGHDAGGALQTRKRNNTTVSTYTWSKPFVWDCGTPILPVPVSVWYKRGTWTGPSATLSNMTLGVDLVKPDATVVNLIPAAQVSGAANSAWFQLSAADVSANFNQAGVYTLRLTGFLQGLTTSDLYLFIDDFNVGITSNYASYSQDVEFTLRATPYSTLPSNAYLLDIRARKHSGDTETTDIQVWNGSAWTTRYSVTSAHTVWTNFNTYYLSSAEYNNGNVRVRYVDAVPTADINRGGIDVEYQRVTVDQSTCVDSVRDIEADCGKCHNFNGDVTKPWPSLGMHNKHAQSESTSDCAWCHPDHTAGQTIFPANHKNGTLEINGTKVYELATVPTNGGTATFDPATNRCSNVDCHKGQITPSWIATYPPTGPYDGINTIARNCSRCHNNGVAGADTFGNLNLNVAWPTAVTSTLDGGGHTSHNSAFVLDEYSCQANGSCHPDNRGNHSVVGDGKVVTQMAPNYGSPNQIIKYFPDTVNLTGTCVNVSCHGGQVTPRFNTSSTNPINMAATNGTACVKCHQGEQATGWGTNPGNATQYNSPISGLHRGSPATSGQDHAIGITNWCQGCHTLASLTRHFQFGGVTNLDTPAMDSMQGAAFVASIGYVAGTGTSPNYTTPPTCATTGTTTCHAENRTAFRTTQALWPRKWSWDSYAAETPESEKVKQCNGCHGHWGTFVAGVVQPHVTSNSDLTLRNTLINNHSESGINCGTMCHGQTDPAYNHGVAVGAATKDMSLNSATNTGYVDGGTYVGCNMCHVNEGQVAPDGAGGNHVFTDAPWVTTTQLAAGPTVSCSNNTSTCHGNGSGQYWPDGTTYPDRAGRHNFHMTKLAARLGYTLPGTDQQQKTMCAYCHTYTTAPGEGGHADQVAPADLANTAFNPIWSTLASNYPNTPDAGTTSVYTPADGTCSGIDCHNNKVTTAGTYGWRDAGTSTCLMCHTVGGAGSNPNTGLHNITVAGPQHHDDGITGGCTACHVMPAIAPASSHVNGTFTADALSNPDRGINPGLTYTPITPVSGRSGTCSSTSFLASCHSDGGNWARLWSTEANSTATATSSARCNVCHGQWSSIAGSSGWMAGTTHFKAGGLNVATNSRGSGHDSSTCDNCHVYGAAGAGRHNVVTRQINLNNNGATPGRTGAVYGTDNAGCGVCHGSQADAGHNFPISYFPTAYVAGSAFTGPTCAGCHASITSHTDADGAGATYPTAGGNFCLDCHTDHSSAPRTGTNGTNNVYIKTTYGASVAVPTMNQQYTTTNHNGWIQLGGNATNVYAKSTEAEMCWACHAAVGVSEWGSNTHTTTGSLAYDYGELYTDASTVPGTKTSNWTTGFWRSGKGKASGSTSNPFWYKRGAIQSTHSVNFDSGTAALVTSGNSLGFGRTENKDAVANIRCSYCHDVHGTHNTVNGDVSGGAGTADAPYLRGSWRGNQYAEDGAPQYGMHNNWTIQGATTAVTTGYGRVPRASADPNNSGLNKAIYSTQNAGGWWIDQNSGNPTSAITGATPLDKASNSSGLCAQCHGSDNNGTWTAAEIGAINWTATGIEATQSNWVSGYNGHANSVIGGAGVADAPRARNIYTRVARGTDRMTVVSSYQNAADMGLASNTITTSRGYSYRSSTSSTGTGYHWYPQVGTNSYNTNPVNVTTAFRAFAWATSYLTGGSTRGYLWATGSKELTMDVNAIEATHDAQANYHTFTCAKCHNPHASRLPKLMITNCLDTNHNTWEDYNHQGSALPAIWANTRHSQWSSAQNCHRLDARAALTTGQTVMLGRGWNRVTPWMEFTNPNSTRTNPNP